MTKQYSYIAFSFVFFSLLFATNLNAQQQEPDYQSSLYTEAIEKIIDYENGQVSQQELLSRYNASPSAQKVMFAGPNTLPTFLLDPYIEFVAFHGNDMVILDCIFSTGDEGHVLDTIIVSAIEYIDGANWIIDTIFDPAYDSLIVLVNQNDTAASRLAKIISIATFISPTDTVYIFDSAYILQGPAPDNNYILISPQVQAIDYTMQITDTFYIINNVTNWEVKNSSLPDWIPTYNEDHINNYISFNVNSNESDSFRQDTIVIQEVGNPSVSDTLTIYQGALSDSVILITPEIQSVDYTAQATAPFFIISFNTNGWMTVALPPWITVSIEDHEGDSIIFNITQNSGDTLRQANIIIRDSLDANISDTLSIYQGALSDTVIVISPQLQSIDNTAQITAPFNIINFNVTNWIVGSPLPSWILIDTISKSGTNDYIKFYVFENNSGISRDTIVVIQDSLNPNISDTLTINQGAQTAQPFISINPVFQSIQSDSGETNNFIITHFNITDWEVDTLSFPSWIAISDSSHGSANDTIRFNVAENLDDSLRFANIKVWDVADTTYFQELTIYQGALSTASILLSPKIQSIEYTGDTTDNFNVIHFNIDYWEVDTTSLPNWITVGNSSHSGTNDYVKFSVSENPGNNSRDTTIIIRDTTNPGISDTLTIVQGAFAVSSILVSPKIQSVSYTADTTDNFNVIHFNIDYWEVDTISLPNWITVGDSSHSGTNNYIRFNVLENTSDSLRYTTVVIQDTSNHGVADTLTIIQSASPFPQLLVAPREQKVAHTGNDSVAFHVITVNTVGNWSIDTNTLKPWISDFTYVYSDSILILEVDSNMTLESRIDSITIYAYNAAADSTVYDTVTIYQYSALDSYLLAEPRERSIDYPKDTVEFIITAVNTDSSWFVDSTTVKDWIHYSNTDTLLTLVVDSNYSHITRWDTISISAIHGDSLVEDKISIYQYAGPEAFLFAAPRNLPIVHTGNDSVTFKITAVNTSGDWTVDTLSLADWVNYSYSYADSLLILSVDTNLNLETRWDSIRVYAPVGDTIVDDTVVIYQYSGLDSYLLSAPRERSIVYTGDSNVSFKVTAVNIDSIWLVDSSSVKDWITYAYDRTDSLMILNIDENQSLHTRIDTIRIFATAGDSVVDDFVAVYQGSHPQPLLFVAPREQSILHAGNDNVEFKVTTVNVDSAWLVDSETVEDWVLGVSYNYLDSLFSLDVSPNTTLQSRRDSIRVYVAAGDTILEDTVTIYQYSGYDSYILSEPHEKSIGYLGDTVDFKVTAVNIDSTWIVDPTTVKGWISFQYNYADSLLILEIEENLDLQTRRDTIRIYASAGDSVVEDFIAVYQYSRPQSLLMVSPREQSVSHNGNSSLVFKVNAVNINGNWLVDSTTVKWDWVLDFSYNYVDSLLILNVDTNRSLYARRDSIRIYAFADNMIVADTCSIYQYSGLDAYILAGPKGVESPHSGSDSIGFVVNSANIGEGGWAYEFLSDTGQWVRELSNIADTLSFSVMANDKLSAREEFIRFYDVQTETIADTVSVVQEAPYIVLRPSSLSNITSHEYSRTIYIFSNLEEYSIKKDITNADTSWYNQDIYIGHLNDSVELTIKEHENANATRSGKLAFAYNENIASNFYFMQNEAPEEYIPISGQILVNGDTSTPLVNNQVFIGDTLATTDDNGFFSILVLKGWKGTVTPEVVDNFFDPPFVEYVVPVIAPSDTNNFIAYPIDPQVSFSLLKTWACDGDELSPNNIERYPRAEITGSVGEITYHWEVVPFYENAISYDSIKEPTFSTLNAPSDSITFTLRINNFGFDRYDSFTLIIRSRPTEEDFSGELEVCKNQAGVIYLANVDDLNDERFTWSLPEGGGSFATDPKTNIAIVNWGNTDGDYKIALKTNNQFCPAVQQVIKTVSISNQEAPPETTVFWKSPDNMLYCTDATVDHYVWGWFEMIGTELGDMTIIEGEHDWYVRLPEGHTFDPLKYHYFVDTYYDSISECASRSFYNPPLDFVELNEKSVSVYPNPTDGQLNIDFTNFQIEQIATLQLYNISGQMIHQEKLNLQSNKQTVQIRELSYQKSGIYFLRIIMDDYFFNSKIIVR